MADKDINFIDPNRYQKPIVTSNGTPDLIIGRRGSSDQLHIHDHANGQTISLYRRGYDPIRVHFRPPGLIDFGK